MEEARRGVTYTDPTSPFFEEPKPVKRVDIPVPIPKDDDEPSQRQSERSQWQRKSEEDLIKQFQAATQILSSNEQAEIKGIQNELLKLRNLPSLDEVLE